VALTSSEQLADPILRPADDCLASRYDDWALEQLFVANQNLNDLVNCLDVGIREFELLELRIPTNQGRWRIFQDLDDPTDRVGVWWVLDIVDGVELNTQVFCNAHGIDRGVSMPVVIDRDISHRHNGRGSARVTGR